jgi:hypothetical protein
MSGVPGYGQEYDPVHDKDIIEDALPENNWQKVIKEQEAKEISDAEIAQIIMANATTTSDPLYNASLIILGSLLSQGDIPQARQEGAIVRSIQLGKHFLEELKNA